MPDSSASPFRLAPALVVAGLLAATTGTALAGDVLVTARGVVVAVTGGVPAAPFSGVVPGEAVEFSVEATGAPFMNSPTFWEYETDPLRGGMRIGTAFLPVLPGGAGVVNLQNGAIDGVTIGAPLAEPFVTGAVAGLFDLSGLFLSSPDIQQLVGRTMTGSFPGASILASTANSAQIEIEIQTISFDVGSCQIVGANSCNAVTNSTGEKAVTSACGSLTASQNNLVLSAYQIPPNTFGFFLCSQTSGFVAQPGTSAGNLCLGGSIGRFVGPGQIRASGALGTISLDIDLTQLPTPNGGMAAQPGATWFFTSWYRDLNAMGSSNFSDRLELTFQ